MFSAHVWFRLKVGKRFTNRARGDSTLDISNAPDLVSPASASVPRGHPQGYPPGYRLSLRLRTCYKYFQLLSSVSYAKIF